MIAYNLKIDKKNEKASQSFATLDTTSKKRYIVYGER